MRLLIRFACLLLCLGVGAVVWVALEPRQQGAGLPAQPSAPATALQTEQVATEPQRKVRVVYADVTTAGLPIGSLKAENRIDPVILPTSGVKAIGERNTSDDVQPQGSIPSAIAGQSVAAATAPRSSVDLNTASVDVLNRIPGAGSIGRTIVAHRPYRSVDDLLNKRVVRRSVFDKIKQQLAAE